MPLGIFVDPTDGDTAATGLTIANTDIKLHKAGATTLANKNSGGATHISGGIYYAVLDATDTDTIGPMVIFIHVAGALTVRLECCVLDEAVFDVRFGTVAPATATNITAIGNDSITAAALATDAVNEIRNAITGGAYDLDTDANGRIRIVDGTGTGELDTASGLVKISGTKQTLDSLNDISAANVNSEVVDALATDTYAEPGQGLPGATISLAAKVNYLYTSWRNLKTNNGSETKLYANDGTTVIAKQVTGSSAGTVSKAAWITGA